MSPAEHILVKIFHPVNCLDVGLIFWITAPAIKIPKAEKTSDVLPVTMLK